MILWAGRLGAGLAVLLLGALIAPAPSALASCVGPTLLASPTSVQAAHTVTVSGSYWAAKCSDTGGPPSEADVVTISFVQGARHVQLGAARPTVGAGLYSFRAVFTVPAWAVLGSARLTAHGQMSDAGASQDVTVTAEAQGSSRLPVTGTPNIAAFGLLAVLILAGGLAAARTARRPR